MVSVTFYAGTLEVGTATYAHINPDASVYVGAPIPRWGGYLGFAGTNYTYDPACWTGPHVHFELRSARHYACWNRGFTNKIGYGLSNSNFLGFIGGNYAAAQYQPCP
jgi:murein DD-endopeptidase MepM/ murein hydrolase activator NlpD